MHLFCCSFLHLISMETHKSAVSGHGNVVDDVKANAVMDKLKTHGSQAKDMFVSGAKSVATAGAVPIHFITSKEVVKYVEKPVGTIKTWLKFTAVMLAASLLLWQLIDKIRSYVDNPVNVSTEYSYMTSLPYPGLIICNTMPLRYSKMMGSPFMAILNETTSHGGWINTSDPEIMGKLEEANRENLKNFYLTNTQAVQDFIVGCKWPGGIGNCSDSDFRLVITDYGPCYRLTIPPSKWPNATAAGSVNSLQIAVNVDIDDGFASTSSKTVGAFVALFPNTDPTPAVSHIGFNVPSGFETSVAISLERVLRLNNQTKGTCIPEKQLILFQNYTTAGCYLQNQLWNRVNACECLPYNLPEYRNKLATDEDNKKFEILLNSSTPCDAEGQFRCVDAQWEMMDSLVSEKIEQPKMACPDACVSDRYTSTLTYSLIGANQLRLSLPKEKRENIVRNREKALQAKKVQTTSAGTDWEKQYYKENFIILNIYFKELVSTQISQHLMYQGLSFAGDIAGTIGIILGFLLTTLGDVIENCQMLYKKVRGVIDPGLEKVVKIIEREERVRPEDDGNGRARHGSGADKTTGLTSL